MLDPVLLADLERVDTDLGGELVHDPLDAEGRLGPTGTAIGIDPRGVGEHRLAVELVGRELVDGVEHPRPEHRHTATDDGDKGAEVGDEIDLEPRDRAVLGGCEGELLVLVAAVVAGDEGLRSGLGVLRRLAQPPRHRERDELLRRGLEFAAEAATHIGGDDADLALRHTRRCGDEEAEDVRDLRGRPHGDLFAGRVDDRGAGLHEGGDEPLLAVFANDEYAVRFGLADGLLHIATGAGGGGVELPEGGLVGALVGVGEHLVLEGFHAVEDGGQLVVVDVDEFGGIAGFRGAAGDDDGDDLTGTGNAVADPREVVGGDLLGGDRPRVGTDTQAFGEVGSGVDADDVLRVLGGTGVDVRDLGVGEGAADHRQVHHAREDDVVGPLGAAGDEALVLLAEACLPDLGRVCGALVDGGHLTHHPWRRSLRRRQRPP